MIKRRGFTLIEMLVVILMIALLMGMLAGSLYSARKRTQIARAEVQLRELVTAWGQYYLIERDNAKLPQPEGEWVVMTRKVLEPLIKPNDNGFVYLNVTLKKTGEEESNDDEYLDPWKQPFHVKFKPSTDSGATAPPVFIKASVNFINSKRE